MTTQLQVRQLRTVLRQNVFAYLLWLSANLGGLLIAYAAVFTIWWFHRTAARYLPGPEAFMMFGSISVAIAGVSYLRLPHSQSRLQSIRPSLVLSISWPLLLAIVYGFLIAMGVKEPVMGPCGIWVTAVLIAACCWLWSTVTWLHEQGLRSDVEGQPPPRPEPSAALTQAAAGLPKAP